MQRQLQQRQCPTSEALGQRSANRGECAQACRLPYQLIVDGEERDLQDQRYLLSPQDLSAWELLPQLEQIGIASLKIEGRLKEATYVAAVTDTYRQGLDRLAEGLPSAPQSAEQRRSLELSFSRGLSKGWLGGLDHQALVHGLWSKLLISARWAGWPYGLVLAGSKPAGCQRVAPAGSAAIPHLKVNGSPWPARQLRSALEACGFACKDGLASPWSGG